jgi:hypothetical protein
VHLTLADDLLELSLVASRGAAVAIATPATFRVALRERRVALGTGAGGMAVGTGTVGLAFVSLPFGCVLRRAAVVARGGGTLAAPPAPAASSSIPLGGFDTRYYFDSSSKQPVRSCYYPPSLLLLPPIAITEWTIIRKS